MSSRSRRVYGRSRTTALGGAMETSGGVTTRCGSDAVEPSGGVIKSGLNLLHQLTSRVRGVSTADGEEKPAATTPAPAPTARPRAEFRSDVAYHPLVYKYAKLDRLGLEATGSKLAHWEEKYKRRQGDEEGRAPPPAQHRHSDRYGSPGRPADGTRPERSSHHGLYDSYEPLDRPSSRHGLREEERPSSRHGHREERPSSRQEAPRTPGGHSDRTRWYETAVHEPKMPSYQGSYAAPYDTAWRYGGGYSGLGGAELRPANGTHRRREDEMSTASSGSDHPPSRAADHRSDHHRSEHTGHDHLLSDLYPRLGGTRVTDYKGSDASLSGTSAPEGKPPHQPSKLGRSSSWKISAKELEKEPYRRFRSRFLTQTVPEDLDSRLAQTEERPSPVTSSPRLRRRLVANSPSVTRPLEPVPVHKSASSSFFGSQILRHRGEDDAQRPALQSVLVQEEDGGTRSGKENG